MADTPKSDTRPEMFGDGFEHHHHHHHHHFHHHFFYPMYGPPPFFFGGFNRPVQGPYTGAQPYEGYTQYK
jgi:hypothetical protein